MSNVPELEPQLCNLLVVAPNVNHLASLTPSSSSIRWREHYLMHRRIVVRVHEVKCVSSLAESLAGSKWAVHVAVISIHGA